MPDEAIVLQTMLYEPRVVARTYHVLLKRSGESTACAHDRVHRYALEVALHNSPHGEICVELKQGVLSVALEEEAMSEEGVGPAPHEWIKYLPLEVAERMKPAVLNKLAQKGHVLWGVRVFRIQREKRDEDAPAARTRPRCELSHDVAEVGGRVHHADALGQVAKACRAGRAPRETFTFARYGEAVAH